jgi:hypothetical protein
MNMDTSIDPKMLMQKPLKDLTREESRILADYAVEQPMVKSLAIWVLSVSRLVDEIASPKVQADWEEDCMVVVSAVSMMVIRQATAKHMVAIIGTTSYWDKTLRVHMPVLEALYRIFVAEFGKVLVNDYDENTQTEVIHGLDDIAGILLLRALNSKGA